MNRCDADFIENKCSERDIAIIQKCKSHCDAFVIGKGAKAKKWHPFPALLATEDYYFVCKLSTKSGLEDCRLSDEQPVVVITHPFRVFTIKSKIRFCKAMKWLYGILPDVIFFSIIAAMLFALYVLAKYICNEEHQCIMCNNAAEMHGAHHVEFKCTVCDQCYDEMKKYMLEKMHSENNIHNGDLQ